MTRYIIGILFLGVHLINAQAPDSFRFEMITTKGAFIAEAVRSYSPNGVDRLYELIQDKYFDNNRIFRVQQGYVAQFGISPDSIKNKKWKDNAISDEDGMRDNKLGTISFARLGPNTRSCQLFINLNNNVKLDTIVFMDVVGFNVVAKIISGIDVIHTWNGEYGFDPAKYQDSIYVKGYTWLDDQYPGLDSIISVRLVYD